MEKKNIFLAKVPSRKEKYFCFSLASLRLGEKKYSPRLRGEWF